MGRKAINMIGQIIKNWKVLKQASQINTKNTSHSIWWECECINCGKHKTFNGTELRLNRVGKCSCPVEKPKKLTGAIIDETGNKYGKLTVLSFAYTKNSLAYWNCVCECGTNKILRGDHLRSGKIKSCGCINSWKEEEIKQILEQNNISFEREYSFLDLKDIKPLRFDFAIFDNSTNNLKGLIEYNGQQHYEENSQFNHYGLLQIHDDMKKQYCELHNIPLLILNKEDNLLENILNWLQTI